MPSLTDLLPDDLLSNLWRSSVKNHHPVQVINFMLEDNGVETVCLDTNWLAVNVLSFNHHAGVAGNRKVNAGKREATLLVLNNLLGHSYNPGITDGAW